MNIDNNCIFCKIIKKEVFAAVLYEDRELVAFLDIKPINEGHTLVVPKNHWKLVEEMDSETYLKMFEIGRRLMGKIKKKLPGITAFNLLIANGEDAGQEIFHVHLHIIPRKPADEFGFTFSQNYGKKLSKQERINIQQKILQ
ncbi:MAG: HIT domain-containing protein [Candidatus Heimdallarchaeota archaeon]|nr:HIT domain-containing protein [Candidatus Heimdallarchaeota archaeon]